MKKVWMFSSENDKNIKIGIRKRRWAYKKSTKTHGGLLIGDYIMLYSKESKNIMCIGLVKSMPVIGKPIYIWEEECWDSFTFDIKEKKIIPLEKAKNILGIEENMSHY